MCKNDSFNKMTLKPINTIHGDIFLPGSKSITNRALLLSSVSKGKTILKNVLESEDTKHMLAILHKLGIKITSKTYDEKRNKYEIVGKGKPLFCDFYTTLFVGNAGTVIRPLTAMLSLHKKNVSIIMGEKRMDNRPIGDLVNALRQGGASISYVDNLNYPPIIIKGGYQGGKIYMHSTISSQFISSIIMMAPLAKKDTYIYIKDPFVVSKPYINMTIKLLHIFGVEVLWLKPDYIFIPGQQEFMSPGEYIIEGDATSASYFIAAGAVKGKELRIHGIGKYSIQGDIKVINFLKKMGAEITMHSQYITVNKVGNLNIFSFDFSDYPDLVLTIGVLSVFCKGPTILKNIFNLRHKESDRISAMCNELLKIGMWIEEDSNKLTIFPSAGKIISNIIETYNDHRIAMAFSLLALTGKFITLLNPKCVNKTYPNFFKDLEKISQYLV